MQSSRRRRKKMQPWSHGANGCYKRSLTALLVILYCLTNMCSTDFWMGKYHGCAQWLFFFLFIHSWLQMDVLKSPPITLLPKNILKAPSHDPTDQTASPAYSVLSNPSAAHPLRNPDQRFLDSEAFTHKFANHLSGPMEKITRRVVKRWVGTKKVHHLKFNMLIAYDRLCTRSRWFRCCFE